MSSDGAANTEDAQVDIQNNRATAYDWLKMWWDYRTDGTYGGYSVQDIFALWEAANPGRLLAAEGGGVTGDFNELGASVHGVQH